MEWELRLQEGLEPVHAYRPAVIAFTPGAPITVGSGDSCMVALGAHPRAPLISREHATLSLCEEGLPRLRDTSTNASRVDKRIVHRSEVRFHPNLRQPLPRPPPTHPCGTLLRWR